MSNEQHQKVIPLLPCKSIDEQLHFYESLGFEITYRQAKPNVYASVRHRIAELHFFVLKQLVPQNSYSMCYIHVPYVDDLYQEFCSRMKKHYKKVPRRGIPRITQLSDLSEDRRFNLIDPAGNYLLIGRKHDNSKFSLHDETIWDTATDPSNAYKIAYRLAYSKDDHKAAAKVLDSLFSRRTGIPNDLLCQALILRADIALTMEDFVQVRQFLKEAKQIRLTNQERYQIGKKMDKISEIFAELPIEYRTE